MKPGCKQTTYQYVHLTKMKSLNQLASHRKVTTQIRNALICTGCNHFTCKHLPLVNHISTKIRTLQIIWKCFLILGGGETIKIMAHFDKKPPKLRKKRRKFCKVVPQTLHLHMFHPSFSLRAVSFSVLI